MYRFLNILFKMAFVITFVILIFIYINIRHNYIALLSSLRNCRDLASSLQDYALGDIAITDTSYEALMQTKGAFCFMDGDPISYGWYLTHPFEQKIVEEGVDGYSSKY